MKRAAAIAVTTLILVFGQAALPASACACGGPAPLPGTEVNVDRETAIVRWDGDHEEIVMQLDMRADTGETGLVIPTPTPATVSAGDGAVFEALLAEIAPETVVVWDWWGGAAGGGDGGAGAPPTVLDHVQLGPIEATTLAATDTIGLQDWLDSNGYELSPSIAAELGPYVDEGWSFVALKLSSETPFNGELDPIRLVFDSDSLVYPMRMSRAAYSPQTVRLYLLGDHRAEVTNLRDDVGIQASTAWASRVEDPALAGLGEFLTVVDLFFDDPATQITSDLEIADAVADEPIIPTITETRLATVLGIPLGPVLVGLLAIVPFMVVLVVRRRRGAA